MLTKVDRRGDLSSHVDERKSFVISGLRRLSAPPLVGAARGLLILLPGKVCSGLPSGVDLARSTLPIDGFRRFLGPYWETEPIRWIVCISTQLLLVGLLACHVEMTPCRDEGHLSVESPLFQALTEGETAHNQAKTQVFAPPLHPSVVGMWLTLASLLALVTFPTRSLCSRYLGRSRMAVNSHTEHDRR